MGEKRKIGESYTTVFCTSNSGHVITINSSPLHQDKNADSVFKAALNQPPMHQIKTE